MIKQENNDIESSTANIPRLAGNSPNLPIKPVVMNIKYVLRKGQTSRHIELAGVII